MYIFSGSLPEEATTYVTREADGELYEGLKAGKFCYVLNSRQSGKSSLRVRTMRRLRESGVECSAIDLSAGGIQNVPPEQWYADLIDTLIESFGLDVEFGDWWSQNQLNSLVTRFRKFIEEILLAEVKENIVIFIDEIDSVLSLNFPTDDFFAFIRACYNQRVDNPEYSRLTFCLLGVASPSNLISDKKRTPFNIGKAISLKGFQLHEVEPLEKGLHGRYSDSQAVMKQILHWTGGQPFLTQKLCQFMVAESEKENPRTVEQVVKSHIIENWESQDEPEHLRTIRDRILRDEQRASYLLELYQQIRCSEEQSEITADETQEQSELQLSGLVVRQQNNLRVYNPIYKEIFDQDWIETQLRNLRPYSENFKFWVASGGSDNSRLLRGKALQDALEWSKDKSLNYQDREFLAASQTKEKEEAIAALEKEAALEREKKDREAVEKRNKVLTEANNKAQWRISIGTVVLILTLFGAVFSGILAGNQVQIAKDAEKRLDEANSKTDKAKDELEKARLLAQQAENQLSSTRKTQQSAEASRKVAESEKAKAKNDALLAGKSANDAKRELLVIIKTRQSAEASRKVAESEKLKAKNDALVAVKSASDAKGELLVIRKSQQSAKGLLKVAESEKTKAKNDALVAVKSASDAKGELLVVHETQQQAQKALKIAQEGEARAKDEIHKAQMKAETAQQRLTRIDEQAKNLLLLSDLSGELQSKNQQDDADEARRQLGLSYAIKENYNLQKALLLSGIAFAYQKLEKPLDATKAIQDSMKLLQEGDKKTYSQEKEVRIYVLNIQGALLKEQGKFQEAIEAYKTAFNLLQSNSLELNPINQQNRIINIKTVGNVHRNLIYLLSSEPGQNNNLLSQVRKSLRNHYYTELKYLMEAKNWKEADMKTGQFMLYLARREGNEFDRESTNNFSCKDLKEIDSLWVKYSGGRFGFSVQKHILEEIINQQKNRLEDFEKIYKLFAKRVGWYDDNNEEQKKNYDYESEREPQQGHFPTGTYTYSSLEAIGFIKGGVEKYYLSGNFWDGTSSVGWSDKLGADLSQAEASWVSRAKLPGEEFTHLLIRCKV